MDLNFVFWISYQYLKLLVQVLLKIYFLRLKSVPITQKKNGLFSLQISQNLIIFSIQGDNYRINKVKVVTKVDMVLWGLHSKIPLPNEKNPKSANSTQMELACKNK
jgi:hypothetical protein